MVELAKTGDIIEWMSHNHYAPGVVIETIEVELPYPAPRRFHIQWLDCDWRNRVPYSNREVMRLYCRGDELW